VEGRYIWLNESGMKLPLLLPTMHQVFEVMSAGYGIDLGDTMYRRNGGNDVSGGVLFRFKVQAQSRNEGSGYNGRTRSSQEKNVQVFRGM
jgi:hypothetical protein